MLDIAEASMYESTSEDADDGAVMGFEKRDERKKKPPEIGLRKKIKIKQRKAKNEENKWTDQSYALRPRELSPRVIRDRS